MTPPLLMDPAFPVPHGFFTRLGGVSGGLYASLQCGFGTKGDDPAAVGENRRRVAAVLGARALVSLHQIHSAVVIDMDELADLPTGPERPQGDAMVTTKPGVALGVLTADCAPVLLADPQAGVIGAAHAGWKGAIAGITDATLAMMVAKGADRARIHAVIGPCIGPGSYETGPEFRARFLAADPANEVFFSSADARGHAYFNLPGYVLMRLRAAGVARAHWLGADTLADERFFSNRRAFLKGEADYGRLISGIMLG